MYTPTRRRESVSESTHKFTPSKRGQAALDALALGYDVQLPEYSFALLPRTSVSEQALASFVSTGTQQPEHLPRSTSFADQHRRTSSGSKQHRNRGSGVAEKKRFARQLRSPAADGRRTNINEDWIMDHSASESSTHAINGDSSSRASTSSYQPNASQYVLDSPYRTRRSDDPTCRDNSGMSVLSSHTPRSMADISHQSSPVRRHSMIIHQTPLASRSQSQNKSNTLIPAYDNEDFGRLPGTRLATRSHPSRPSPLPSMTPLPESSSVERPLDAYFSPRNEEYQTNVQQLGGNTQCARIHSGISGTRSSNGQSGGARPQALKSPAWSISGARHSPVDRVTRQLPENEIFHGDPGPSRSHHHHSSSEPPVPVTSARRNSRPQAGSQRPQFTPSLMVSSLPSYGTSPSSGQYTSGKPRLRVTTQSITGLSTQPLRSAPLPSTSTSSHTTPSSHEDDEAFKVHPERAAVSRMETLLMLNACRAEAVGPKSGGIIGHPTTDGVVIVSPVHDHLGYPGPSPQTAGHNYQTLTYPNLLGLSDTKIRGPAEAPRDVGFRTGTVIPAQERSPANRRPRQRSGSVGTSTLPDSTHRPRGYHGSYRNRQRSASVIVQGLSPDAVKKLRMYEQIKYQDRGKPESLREIVGCTARYKVYVARVRKNAILSPSKTPISPAQVPLPPSPVLVPISPQKETSFIVPLVAKLSNPSSPRSVLLPLSPPQSPSLCATTNHSSPVISSLISSDSLMRYRASQGIQSPRPIRTRQNTQSGRVVPTLRLISSPDGIDPQPGVDTTQTELAEKTKVALERGATPLDEQASLKSEGLKLEPQLERILTPPPAFWSPPPNSAVIRTSAPLPLLPAANISTPATASISLPATRTSSAPPLRPMSVPPPGDCLRVGESEDVRRAWSCQPATAELPPIKSFAGDWKQCMVIELSDEEEEEEEEETTDTDFSELEDEDLDDCQVLDVSDVVADGDLITLPSPKSNSVDDARMGAASQDKPAESRTAGKGAVSSGIGSGVNAVEAVQHAIVKLALDNAETMHSERTMETRPKRLAAPIRAGSMTGTYQTTNQPFSRHSLDFEHLRGSNPLHALPNQYLPTMPRASYTPNLPVYSHHPANFSLECLKSGLELRAAASASAVEEAVRARSASPIITSQDGHVPSSRPNPGFVLPPRLQRLQSIHPRTTTPIPTPRLDIPPLPTPRLDIPALQQRRPCYESPLRSAPLVTSLYPAAFNVPRYPVLTPQIPLTPLVQGRGPMASNVCTPRLEQPALIPRHSSVSEAPASSSRVQLASIVVDNKPVPPAPTTAPLPRKNGGRKRQTRRSAEAVLSNSEDSKLAPMVPAPAPPILEPALSVETPTTRSSASSPQPKQKGGKKRWHKHRKNPAPEQAKAATPTSSTPVIPKPKESAPAPRKVSVSLPKKNSVSAPKSDSVPTMTLDESLSSTPKPKPKRKYKPPKRHKSAKPGAVPTPVHTVCL
ncbi:unnamed protein product [Rhizoctonia solani]|uniref:Uncharacterized protein n=1 Tax=Rhizoctonia solani TaxID=456999 RepID=A0A8H2WCI8_9AGAM|nr:unnamed protein product [Rhizoctonia solani]